MPNTIARIVKTQAGTFAVNCHDGNGRIAGEPDNTVTLTPMSTYAVGAGSATTLAPGFYSVRVARGLAAGTKTNSEGQNGLRALVAHPNSVYLGTSFETTRTGRSGKWVEVEGSNGKTAYIGQREGGNSAPLGWAVVYFNGR